MRHDFRWPRVAVHSQSNNVDYESISGDAADITIAVEYLSVPLTLTAGGDASGDNFCTALCRRGQDASAQEAQPCCTCVTMLLSLPVHLRYQPSSADGRMFGDVFLPPPEVRWRAVRRANATKDVSEEESCALANSQALSADSSQDPFAQSKNSSGTVFRYYDETHLGAQSHIYDSYSRDTGREFAEARNYCPSREWLPTCGHLDGHCAVPGVVQMRMPLGDSRDFNFVFVTTIAMYVLSALALVLILTRRRTEDGGQS